MTVALSSDASTAIPAGRTHQARPSPARHRPGEGRPVNLAVDQDGTPSLEQRLASCGADLIAGFSPFDRSSVEQAIDQFLDRLDDLETELSRLGTKANLMPSLTATAIAIATTELFHRWLGKRPDRARRVAYVLGGSTGDGDADADASFPGLPGLPYSWSLEER
jgi:hypothetical protein